MANKNLVKLAKGSGNKTKTSTTKKSTEKKVVEKPLTSAEERDIKAKQKVQELLEGVPHTSLKNDEIFEIESEGNEKSVEWLGEQVSKLSENNEKLKSELVLTKEDYLKILTDYQKLKQGGDVILSDTASDTALKVSIIKLFSEIQANYIALGKNFVIVPPAFLNRLIMFFPFLASEKRF